MSSAPRAARFEGLTPASGRASNAARGSSRKRDTRCELLLRRALWAAGLRYRVDVSSVPGRPDIVFLRLRIAVFVDGDFWHGRSLDERVAKLERGHNAPYWVAKIRGNRERDARHDAALRADGWLVLRFWETDVRADVGSAVEAIVEALRSRQGF